MSNKIVYGSVCSGVEAASVAWHELGWKPAWFCEFDKFPSAVLAHRFPNVPNLHDMTEIHDKEVYNDRSIDLLVGGTPCQSFSVAGLRQGLDDERGNLALEYCKILKRKQPRWFVWENVPGVTSSWSCETQCTELGEWEETNDLSAIFCGFRECGYQFAYRILDAQYFGVPQRRRRIFVVGHLGDWRPAASVLFERESLQGDIAPIGSARADLTRSFKVSPSNDCQDVIAFSCKDDGRDASFELCPTLLNQHHDKALYFQVRSQSKSVYEEQAGTITASDYKEASIVQKKQVLRRLTPIEYERLQGFPDDWTKVPYKDKSSADCPDAPRYKAMGNSMAVPVMKWIGERIQAVEEIIQQ